MQKYGCCVDSENDSKLAFSSVVSFLIIYVQKLRDENKALQERFDLMELENEKLKEEVEKGRKSER